MLGVVAILLLAVGCDLESPGGAPQPGNPPPTRISIQPTRLNICNPECNTDHNNWIEFSLPSNQYVAGSLSLDTQIIAFLPLAGTSSSSPCRGGDTVAGRVCIEMGISHTLLTPLVNNGVLSLSDLRNLDNWTLVYTQR